MENIISLLRQAYKLENTHKNLIKDIGVHFAKNASLTRVYYILILHYVRKCNLPFSEDDFKSLRSFVNEPIAKIDPISTQSWFTTTSEHCSKRYWGQVGLLLKSYHQNQCAICGEYKTDQEIEIQELWDFDDVKKIQTLRAYYPICINCQDHVTVSSNLPDSEKETYIQFLSNINKWNVEEAKKHLIESLKLADQRNQAEWIVDVEYLVSELKITPNNYRENIFDHAQKQSMFHYIQSIQEDAKLDFKLKVEIDCRFSIF